MLAAAVAYGAIKASKILHEALLDNIMRCPMSFFDTTPLGRLINRFSKDVDTMDAELRMFIQVWSGTGKLLSFEAAFFKFSEDIISFFGAFDTPCSGHFIMFAQF